MLLKRDDDAAAEAGPLRKQKVRLEEAAICKTVSAYPWFLSQAFPHYQQ